MAQPGMAVRVAGTWFATASFLMVPVFVLHGPIAHDLNDQMHRIADGALRWTAMVAGVGSFAGWALGMLFGVGFGNLLWVASSLVMSPWSLWFAVALMRSRTVAI